MPQKEKRSIPPLNPHVSYKAKADYYERYSTQELLSSGHLEEVGIRRAAVQTETLSVRVDKALLSRLKQTAKKSTFPCAR